jgi:phospholipase D1/2
VPSTARKEHTVDEQEHQQREPRGDETSSDLHGAKATEENSLLTNGHARGGSSKHESLVTEKATGPQVSENIGGSRSTENANGSAFHDKGKKARGEPPPFTKQEREDMEALLDELCGHLGQFLGGFGCSACAHWLIESTVVYPTRFLEGEDVANNFLFNTDRLLPLLIYD